MDARRQPFAAIYVLYPFTDTSEAVHDRFGPAGLVAWMYLILAAKRAPVQGTVTCVSEHGFWEELGCPIDCRPPLDEFLTLLGQRKQTRKTRSRQGVTHVTLTNFQKWQKMPRTWSEADRKRRKRLEKTDPDSADNSAAHAAAHAAPDMPPERRGEEPIGSLEPTVVGADATPDAALADAGGAGSRNGQYAEALAYVHSEAAPPDPDELALALLDRWPDLADHDIQELVLAATTDEPPL